MKLPLEKATGQDFFRGRPIVEINDGTPLLEMVSMFEAMPDPIEKQFKDIIQWSEHKVPEYRDGEIVGERTKYTATPFALHLMRNMFTSRLQNTIGFMSDEEQSRMLRAIRFFTGVHAWSIDKETQNFFNDMERYEELKEYLDRMGVGSTFERFYEPQQEERGGFYSPSQ